MDRFLFPRWVNRLMLLLGGVIAVGIAYVGALGGLITDPQTLNVGYQPNQPVPFSHALHAGELKMDCRYCHNTVFDSAQASIPPTATCINCHSPVDADGQTALAAIQPLSTRLEAVHESWETGRSIPWTRVHNLPDFVYFDHSVHVNSGVSCVTCHGRIDKMETVYQAEQLSMAWCLDCHRNPESHIRPVEHVTQLDWQPEEGVDRAELGRELMKEHNLHPKTHCAVCHR